MDSDVGTDTSDPNNSDGVLENKVKLSTIYYGVYIPSETNNREYNVFDDKESVLKLAKKHKKARFKSFQFYHEAVDFSINGCEIPLVDGGDLEKKDVVPTSVGEKASPFRTPRPQDLTDFRNKIETGNLNYVKEIIDLNPRYLVSSGDTPSILQEGARLNAIHVAAKMKNADICEYILQTISNPEFIKKLYGDDSQRNAEQRCKMLLDLYLNTPNKGFNDTPLHIAAKWGADQVVEVLLAFPECDKTKRNKHNKLAEHVICERSDPKTSAATKKKIQQLLSDSYYVPLLRTEDNTLPASIGEPFSPTSPPVFNNDPLSPRLEIHAYAGPMDKKGAENFRRVWKTPPRSLNLNSPDGKKAFSDSLSSLRLKDPEKGLERIGSQLANSYNTCWKEYWEFLDSFIDISSEEGLSLLENHLKNKEKHLQEPFEVFSPLMNNQETVVSPITRLCNAFSACTLQDSSSGILNGCVHSTDSWSSCRPLIYVDKACQVFANRIISSILTMLHCNDREYENTLKVLETDAKLLELLIDSYMTDERFAEGVNFQKVHSRIAHLVALKLRENYKDCDDGFLVNKLETILESLVKKSDYFSSDDEGPNYKDSLNKPTMYRKQVACLLSRLKDYAILEQNSTNSNDLNSNPWQWLAVCNCVFHRRKPKRNNLSRNSSFKNYPISKNQSRKFNLQNVSKKLCFGEDLKIGDHVDGASRDSSFNLSSDSSKSDSEDDFYTPVGSPSEFRSLTNSDSEDQYSDAELPKVEVFLVGTYPTKTDQAVFNALRYANCDIDVAKYPQVYKWHHLISLFKETERKAWPNSFSKLLTPESGTPEKSSNSKRPWLRITGASSPKAKMNFTHQ
ncbi:ankyrin repeat and LEM domain-containing protein 2 homolog isoform X2 [Euwallacea fornicatus]|uniref:ankyrin repeat and LEM domain-containing protein 2 homolog isoform X2 n=1 Tax=Euwallacea fornicatus TaxID=995702 RepID=UPI00338DD570